MCEVCNSAANPISFSNVVSATAGCVPCSRPWFSLPAATSNGTCAKGTGVKTQCTANADVVCENCVGVRTSASSFYNDALDTSACKTQSLCPNGQGRNNAPAIEGVAGDYYISWGAKARNTTIYTSYIHHIYIIYTPLNTPLIYI